MPLYKNYSYKLMHSRRHRPMVLNLSLAANLRSAFVVFVYTNLLFSSRLRFTRGVGPLATGVTSLKFCFTFCRATGVTSLRLF